MNDPINTVIFFVVCLGVLVYSWWHANRTPKHVHDWESLGQYKGELIQTTVGGDECRRQCIQHVYRCKICAKVDRVTI